MSLSAENITELESLRNELKRGTKVISVSGLTSISAKSFILANLQDETGKTFAVVTDSNRELEIFESDLKFFQTEKDSVLTLPSFESDVYSNLSPHAETLEQRALTLWNLVNRQPAFLVTSARSLVTRILSPTEVKNLGVRLKRDEDFAPEKLIEKLTGCGYVREEPIKNVGEFSLRGGIVDIWSPAAENPVRLEFFGDTVDSIREFDAETQLSIGHLKEIQLAPMREFSAGSQDLKDWAFFAKERFFEDKYARNLKDRTQFAEEGETFNGWENLYPLANPKRSNILEFLHDCVLVVDEPIQIEQTLGDFYESLQKRYEQIVKADDIGLQPDELFLSVSELQNKLEKLPRIEFRALGKTAAQTDEEFSLINWSRFSSSKIFRYGTAFFSVIALTFLLQPVHEKLSSTTTALLFLLIVLFTATFFGRNPALLSASSAMLCFNYFFLQPVQTWTISEPQNLIAWGAFTITAVIAGELSAYARRRAEEAEKLYVELQTAFEAASQAKAVKQSEKLKTALLDAVTHDLRTPLTSIKASVTMLLEEAGEESIHLTLDKAGKRELLEIIDEESDRLNDFVESMVEMAKIEAGEFHFRISETHIGDVIENALLRASGLLTHRTLAINVPTNLSSIKADSKALTEVLFNLLDNAVKYSPENSKIEISVAEKDNFIEITVEDEGKGIDNDSLEKVFERFYRNDKDSKGFGMGLAIVRGIVEAHNGNVKAAKGKIGAKFIIKLPVKKDE